MIYELEIRLEETRNWKEEAKVRLNFPDCSQFHLLGREVFLGISDSFGFTKLIYH